MPWYAILGLVYIVTHLISLAVGGIIACENPYDDNNFPFLSPRIIYEATEMNWVGCVIMYMIYFAIIPGFAILKFIWWLFHAGRD